MKFVLLGMAVLPILGFANLAYKLVMHTQGKQKPDRYRVKC